VGAFTILGSAGPLQVGHAPGKVWVGGAFLSVGDARRLAELAGRAADAAEAEEGEEPAEHPVEPGQFL
jgi:hypothetical protein